MLAFLLYRAGARAVDLEGPDVYEGRPIFGIKLKSHCLQNRKLVEWGGGGSMSVGVGAGPAIIRQR